jgi:hypothetical protein
VSATEEVRIRGGEREFESSRERREKREKREERERELRVRMCHRPRHTKTYCAYGDTHMYTNR